MPLTGSHGLWKARALVQNFPEQSLALGLFIEYPQREMIADQPLPLNLAERIE
jgi:hypothetical protein